MIRCFNSSSRKSANRRSRIARLEQLEDRQLLAADLVLPPATGPIASLEQEFVAVQQDDAQKGKGGEGDGQGGGRGLFLVDTPLDVVASDGFTSLREAITLANNSAGPDMITFDAGVFSSPQTINLTGQLPTITDDLAIYGPGADYLTIDGQDSHLISYITSGADRSVSMSDLTLANGRGFYGGAINSREELTLTGVVLRDNLATANGGAISMGAGAPLTIHDSTLTGNTADAGGAISGNDIKLYDTVLSNNHATDVNGGAVRVNAGRDLAIYRSTLANNSAAVDGGALWMGGGGNLVLEDSAITGGTASFRGAGIYIREGVATITGSDISNNTMTNASYGGAGIQAHGSALSISNSTLSGNSALAGSGGAIGLVEQVNGPASAVIEDSTLDGNYTSSTGGAIFADASATLTVERSTISNNTAPAGGGGIFTDGDVTVTDSVVSGNRTTAVGGEGGGIKAERMVTLLRSTVSANITEGDHGDGAGVHSRRSIFVTESTVSGNTAMGIDGDGGGLFALDHINLISSTVSGNVTQAVGGDGGGLLAFDDLIMTNSTVTDNHAMQSSGGGVRVLGGNKIVDNSILAGNTAGLGNPDIVPGTGVFWVNHSLIGTGVTPDAGNSGDNTSSDAPMLAALADNGGSTETHRPLPGSPVINAGDNAMAGSTDQTGADRISGGIVDIGSVEAHPAAVRDLGVIPEGTTNEPGQAIRAGEVFFYRFELSEDVIAAQGDSFVIDTFGSTTSVGNSDTEVGLFRSDGTLVTSNDAISFPAIAEAGLTFGIHTAQQNSSGDLPAGEYYLALSVWDTAFGADFDTNRTQNSFVSGTMVVNFNLTQVDVIDPDFNDDGNIDGIDIDMLQANIVNGPADPAMFDLTGDGQVTIADRDEWLVQAGAANLPSGNPYLLGDATLDGVVDGQDFIRWNTNKFMASSAWTGGDFNVDGLVDGQDFLIWNNNKFMSADASAVVAEPGSVSSAFELADDDKGSRHYERHVDDLFAALA